MADALASSASEGNFVGVQVPSAAGNEMGQATHRIAPFYYAFLFIYSRNALTMGYANGVSSLLTNSLRRAINPFTCSFI